MIMIFQWVFCEEAEATLAKEIRAAFFCTVVKRVKKSQKDSFSAYMLKTVHCTVLFF